jgi:guanylate kinase
MVFVALFGPPGVGKSDLIRLAQESDIEAYDIETFGHSYEERKAGLIKVLGQVRGPYVLFGAADMKIKDFPVGTKTILLLPPILEYKNRVEQRDKEYPHKAGQDDLGAFKRFFEREEKFDIVFREVVSDKTLLNEILNKTKNNS